ncbi:MAG: D-alanyl-D-alanine carboxypeptidase [Clostridia bacterium]|nr:D-alanyl-D-alanine carboxypeptidase [Clostridia bacterium]
MKRFLFILVMVIVICGSCTTNCVADDFEEEEYDEYIDDYLATTSKVDGDINLNSRIAVAYDRENNRVIWGKDENKKTAMASTTKIMTAIVTIENSNIDDQVEISAKAAATGGSRLGLKKGDKISLRDLLYGLMLRSGNDAAVAIAEYVAGSVPEFANMMNQKADKLHLKTTNFVTPHGLDDPEHYTTATELAKIADYALDNETFCKIVGSKNYTITINGYPKSINNTNELLGYLPNVYGVKTGFTNNAGRCLVTSIKKDNMDIITIVIQADTKKDRTKDSINLINYIFGNYEKINIQEIVDKEFKEWCDINLGRIHVKKANIDCYEVYKDDLKQDTLILNKNQISKIKTEINAVYNYEAPIDANTLIGEQKILVDNEIIEIDKIYFKNFIDKKCVWDYFKLCMTKL